MLHKGYLFILAQAIALIQDLIKSTMSMNDPAKYEQYNSFQKRDAIETLERYNDKINWKPNASIIDLGCGDGLVTQIALKEKMPKDYKELIGLDISKAMIDYATKKYGDDRTKFFVADLSKEISAEFKGKFDHVFSSYVLQFIPAIEIAFQNIYDLLKPGGSCIIIMLGEAPYFETYYQLSKLPKYQEKLKHVHEIMPKTFYEKNWMENFKSMLQNIGFKDFIVEDKPSNYIHEKSLLRGMVEATNFFNYDPSEPSFKDFFDSYMEYLFKNDKVEKISENYEKFRVNYSQVIVFAKK